MITTLLPKDKVEKKCKKRNVNDAALILTGMVDGIAEEIYFDASEEEEEEEEEDVTIQEDSMKLRNIVIEVKHRMVKSANRAPPLYDQIQCVAYVESNNRMNGHSNNNNNTNRYCLMLGCDAADLVAIARHGNDKEDEIVVTRVNLDERPYQHRKHWFEVVVPRLYSVSNLVKKLRLDANARRRFVTCDDVERWTILAQYLDFLNLNDHMEYNNALKRRDSETIKFQQNIQIALELSLVENARKKRKVSKKKENVLVDWVNRTRSGCVYSPIKK